MGNIRELRLHILRTADATQEVPVFVLQWSRDFGISDRLVRDEVIDLFEKDYITLAAWDGHMRKPFNQWPDAQSFFVSPVTSNNIWMQLGIAGKAFLENEERESRLSGVFISHIFPEREIAFRLKALIEKAFGPGFVFLSSDNESLRGGEDWYTQNRRSTQGGQGDNRARLQNVD
jgi:hypothetical protein